MITLNTITQVREYRRSLRGTVGVVPTMGFLHEGHASLIRAARRECSNVVVTIFVNPTQFGPNEDFARYPRDLKRDQRICKKMGADMAFAPLAAEMYSSSYLTSVQVAKITKKLCGKSRPGHFNGVTTVVAKLFNIIQPDFAYFGQKDLQQCLVVKQMINDLNFPLEICMLPIVREKSGLALSSRNTYLNKQEQEIAPSLYRSLQTAQSIFSSGVRDAKVIKNEVRKIIEQQVKGKTGRIDYVELIRTKDLSSPLKATKGDAILLAVYLGKTRLIDNLILQ